MNITIFRDVMLCPLDVDVLEEHTGSIFRAEVLDKQQPARSKHPEEGGKKLYSCTSI
jgi:hypothetical protein